MKKSQATVVSVLRLKGLWSQRALLLRDCWFRAAQNRVVISIVLIMKLQTQQITPFVACLMALTFLGTVIFTLHLRGDLLIEGFDFRLHIRSLPADWDLQLPRGLHESPKTEPEQYYWKKHICKQVLLLIHT